jgi:site-specific DNA recombinase
MATTTRNGTRRPDLAGTEATTQPVAIYARVSTEDQAERGTIKSQLDFLRRYVDLHELPLAGEYVDDGISGTIPLKDRPEGGRLLADAEAGRFDAIIVYRVDRLGRSLRALLDAHDTLADHGVAIRSGTEPIDTTTPIGAFIFQLLSSLAELEKNTISERTSRGRHPVTADGKWTNGPIPFGYELDAKGHLVTSARRVEALDITEAELVAQIFARMAGGETTINKEYERLNVLGIPREMRFGGEKARVHSNARGWQFSSLQQLLHNPTYKGEGAMESRFGRVALPSPAIVDAATWDAAQAAMLRNRRMSTKNAKHDYWLRGLIRCENCGRTYSGAFFAGQRRYRCCGGTRLHPGPDGKTERCFAEHLPADWIEDAVWQECRAFILNPGPALDEARRKLRHQMTKSAGFDAERRTTLTALAEKETERERILTMYRRGKIDESEAEAQLDAIAKEAGQLREQLEIMRAQAALIDASEAFLTESAALLVRLREELAEIEAANDWTRKRAVIERYVRQITVKTRRVGPRKLEADVRVFLRLRPAPIAIETTNARPGGSASRCGGPAPGR